MWERERDFLTALMDMTWERERREDEKENKRVISLRRCHSALRIHLKRFSDSFLLLIKMTNIKFSFNSLLFDINMEWVHFLWKHMCVCVGEWVCDAILNCIKKWVEIFHMSNGIFLREIFHFSLSSNKNKNERERETLSEKCNAFHKCVHHHE